MSREPRADEHLPDHRLDFLRALGQSAVVDRHVAPAEQHLAFGAIARSISCSQAIRDAGFLRQEHHADAVLADRRQRDAELAAGAAEERVGDLDQDAGAVALQRVGAGRAAVGEVVEDRAAPA